MRKAIFILVCMLLLSSCTQSVWIEEIGDDFKENVESYFAIAEVNVQVNGIQDIKEIYFSALENNDELQMEDDKEDGYFLFIADPDAMLTFVVSDLPEGFVVMWKNSDGDILNEGVEYKFSTPYVETSIDALILNEDGNAEGLVKFRVRNSEV